MLGCSIAGLCIWAATGFDNAEGSVPIIGIQWSSFSTFTIFIWALVVNLQEGGISKISQLGAAALLDVKGLAFSFRHPLSIPPAYPEVGIVDSGRAVSFGFMLSLASLFAFENIWVLLYDRLEFGSWLWPVYFAKSSPSVLVRNLLALIIPLILGPLTLFSAMQGGGESIRMRWKITWRFDANWLTILLATLDLWLFWAIAPFPHTIIPWIQNGSGIFPSMQYFPQTSYTAYPSADYLRAYPIKDIAGFFISDPFVHLINVTAKFMTFLSICYPAMAKVELAK